ncbi:MAG TPA: hypothetical protein VIM84_02265, partial [Gemmatimonadales bacterium]
MKRSTPMLGIVRTFLSEYFELFMTSVGVMMAMLITLSELTRGEQGMAMVFVIWLQGIILWAVHRHGVLRSRALIKKMRMMVQDRVNNRLTLWLSLSDIQSEVGTESGRVERQSV